MVNFIEPISNQDAFITRLFEAPGNKAVINYDQKNTVDPAFFYAAANHFLNRHLGGFNLLPIPEKKFPKLNYINTDIKLALKYLTDQDKFNKTIRPALTNVFYNAEENTLTATNCHILLSWQSTRHQGGYRAVFGNENLLLNIDAVGNIIKQTESEFKDGKYPDYNRVIPEGQISDDVNFIDDAKQDILFHFINCAKVLKIERPIVKLGNHYFNAYLLCRVLMYYKIQRPNDNLIIRTPKEKGRAAYFMSVNKDHKGVIMPMIFEENEIKDLHFKLS